MFRSDRTSGSLKAALAAVFAAGVMGAAGFPGVAQAATPLKVGVPQADSFSFVPLTIGKELGFFKKNDVNITVQSFAGTKELEAALAKGTVQIAMGSGTEFAFIPKGAPDTAVASLAVKPSELVVTTRPDSGIKSVGDLKGTSVGVKSANGLPAWLVRKLSESKGWGANGITAKAVSGALTTGNKINPSVKSIVAGLHTALDLADHGNGKTLVNFGDVVKAFPFYVAFARNDLLSQNSDAVKDFLAGWFRTVKWMGNNKADAIKRASKAIGASQATTTKLYETLMPAFSPNGKFDSGALKTLATALVDMKVLGRQRDLGRYVNQELLATTSGCQSD